MSQFKFLVLEMRGHTPQEWLKWGAKRYDDQQGDDPEYRDLIEKHKLLLADDFRRIGKWKDGAATEGRWKPNIASVAYLVWEQAAEELPKCPEESAVAAFLENWSDREYTDEFRNGQKRKKHFGVPRATTLLHFISGGRYPIFDARVRTAIARLLGQPELPNTVRSYVDSLPLFQELAEQCEAQDFRMLDKALFSYGALDEREFSN